MLSDEEKDTVDGRTDEPGTESLKRFAISRKPRGRCEAAASSTREGSGPHSAAHNRSGCVDRADEDPDGRRKLVSSITASGYTISPRPIIAPKSTPYIYAYLSISIGQA